MKTSDRTFASFNAYTDQNDQSQSEGQLAWLEVCQCVGWNVQVPKSVFSNCVLLATLTVL